MLISPPIILAVQTDLRTPGAEPSADDFLAREKALLGDDAEQFTTTQDSEAAGVGVDSDLLDGVGSNVQSTFESQFPDIAAVQQASSVHY